MDDPTEDLFVIPGKTGLAKLKHYKPAMPGSSRLTRSQHLVIHDKAAFIDRLKEEFEDTFSSAQMGQFNVWRANERARAELRKRRKTDPVVTKFSTLTAQGVEVPSVATQSLFAQDTPDVKVPELTKKESYSIPKVLKLRDDLLAVFDTAKVKGAPIMDSVGAYYGEYLNVLVAKFSKLLGVSPGVMEQSLRGMAQQYTDGFTSWDNWRAICWRLAGFREHMLRGIPCTERPRLLEPEWAPLLVESCAPTVSPDGTKGFVFSFRILGGSMAGVRIHHRFPNKSVWYLHKITFALPRLPKDKKASMYNYLGLQTWVLLEPTAPVSFSYTNTNSAVVSFNREIFAGRNKQCPKGLTVTCHNCRCGVNQCQFATHVKPVVSKACPFCHNLEADFYVGDNLEAGCITCRTKWHFKKESESVGFLTAD